MRFLKYLLLLLLFITTGIVLGGGESVSIDPGWGLGVIVPLKTVNLDFKMNLPDKPISLYDNPAGAKIGNLSKSKEFELSYQILATSPVSGSDLSEVDYQGFCLKYYQKANGYVNVLTHTSKDGYWVSIKELGGLNYQASDWRSFLLTNFRGYHPLDKNGLGLYEKPASNSKVLALLRGHLYVVNLTGKTKDPWAEALVQLYDRQPCDGGSVIKEYKGWIKIINENLYPTIWINAEGC